MTIQPYDTHDAITLVDQAPAPITGKIVYPPAIASHPHHDTLDRLLPGHNPHPYIRHTRQSLTDAAINGVVRTLSDHKAAVGAILASPFVEGIASVFHYTTNPDGPALVTVTVSALSGIVAGMASLIHINQGVTAHPLGTHHGGHIGTIIATAFGVFVSGTALAVTLWRGPLDGGSWIAGFLALGAGVSLAVRGRGLGRGHTYVLETDRVRATAQLAAATQSPAAAANSATAGNHPDDGRGRDHFALLAEWALTQAGFAGAAADGPAAVLAPDRWTVVVNLQGATPAKVIAKTDDLAALGRFPAGALSITPGAGAHQIVWSVIPAAGELPASGPHPIVDARPGDEISIWDPIRFGLDDDTQPVPVVIAGTPGFFVAGEPRMGKSNLMAAAALTAIAADDARLWTIDASQRELTIYEDVADEHVGADMDKALALLAKLQEEITRRGALLTEARATELTRELAHDQDLDVILLLIDELAFFTRYNDRKKAQEFSERLRDVLSRGGACGCSCGLATQKPQDKVVPSEVRDLVNIVIALKCRNPSAVGVILGPGEHNDLPAHLIRVHEKGVAYIKGLPDREPCRMRTHLISVPERYEVVDRFKPYYTKPEPPPGGGIEDERPAALSGGLHLVPTYPGSPSDPPAKIALWSALIERFPGGFSYRDAGTVGVYAGRGGVQAVMDQWRDAGYIIEAGSRVNPRGGPPTTLWKPAARRRIERAG